MGPVSNIALDLVSTTQYAPLGHIVEMPSATGHDEQWVYIQNSSGAAWALGDIIAATTDLTYKGTLAPTSSSASKVRGVCVTPVPDGSFAWIKKKGRCTITNGTAGAIAALDNLVPDSAVAGRAMVSAAVTTFGFGYALTAAAAGVAFTGMIDCKY